MSVGSLSVNRGATFGGVGPWYFAGPAVFQAGSTFAVTLNGTIAGIQYTQLVDADSTTGINLGNSLLSASIDYEYQAGDQFTIATGPLVQGMFQNTGSGTVLLGNNVPFAVSYSSTAVTLTALQSETTTRLSSSSATTNPGRPVTFTATVSTRTSPVTTGTVQLHARKYGPAATVPVTAAAGTAAFTTSALPLGNTSITAVYSGAANILGSTSAALTQVVVPYTTSTTLSSSANPSRTSQSVTFAATVTADGMPVTTGTVEFTRGNTLLGAAAVGAGGTASLAVSSLPVGLGRIQAIYNGTPDYFSSTSPILVQSVAKLATLTTLALTTQVRPNGRVFWVLESFVSPVGVTGITVAGTVVFRRNGLVIGRARHLTVATRPSSPSHRPEGLGAG